MVVYVTPAGKTALHIDNFLDKPKEEFGIDLTVALTDIGYASALHEKYQKENLIVVPIYNPYFGQMDYVGAVRRLVKEVLLFGRRATLIVINSSGGTEKMTNIVKDAGEILQRLYPIKRVFGVYNRDAQEVVFTEKPNLDHGLEAALLAEEIDSLLSTKEKEDASSCVDIDSERSR